MQKNELRRVALAERMALTDVEFDSDNAKLLVHFSKLNFSQVKVLHVFLPIVEKREPNTFLLIDWLKANKPTIKIIIPKADFATSFMTHHHFTNKEDLKINQYFIPEPQNTTPYEGDIDMVLVPLLAFDAAGHRVGYGKGFYDRFLQNTKAKKIGLSLASIPVDISDLHNEDIALDLCITPAGITTFK